MFDMFTGEHTETVQEGAVQTEINFLAGETFTDYSDLSANAGVVKAETDKNPKIVVKSNKPWIVERRTIPRVMYVNLVVGKVPYLTKEEEAMFQNFLDFNLGAMLDNKVRGPILLDSVTDDTIEPEFEKYEDKEDRVTINVHYTLENGYLI